MFSRKTLRRLDWVFNLTLASLILNLALPVRATVAETTSARTLTTSQQSVGIQHLPVLPGVADKPIASAKYKLVVRSSAYSSTRDQTDSDPMTTASGSKVHDGIIATNGLPFGTKVRIPQYFGNKIFTVEDRMSAKWGKKKIDIWMTTRQQARQWGVRTVTIEIL